MKIKGEMSYTDEHGKIHKLEGKIILPDDTIFQKLRVDGKAKIEEIEADEFILDSRSSTIGEIKCRKLKIFSNSNDNDEAAEVIMSKIFGAKVSVSNENLCVRIKKIDAEKVNIKNCEIEKIKCKDAVIGENCTIDKLIVSGEYEIAADSKVGEIVKEDTQ